MSTGGPMEFKGERKRPMLVGQVETVNVQTGEVTERRSNAMTLMPPPEGVCPECAVDHPHDQPHNQQSVYYQYHFHATHGRWPTWTDAMAHCADEVRAAWRTHLIAVMREQSQPIPIDLLEDAGGRR